MCIIMRHEAVLSVDSLLLFQCWVVGFFCLFGGSVVSGFFGGFVLMGFFRTIKTALS